MADRVPPPADNANVRPDGNGETEPHYKKIRPNTTPAVVRSTSHLWGEEIMVATDPPRNVIYYNSNANQIPLAGIASLSYTDVIIGFLVPDSNLNLIGAGGAFDSNLQNNIMALQSAGKNVLISVGGSAGFPSSA
jgi:hypothetical protein